MTHGAIDVFYHDLPPNFSRTVSATLTGPSVTFERARQFRVMVDLSACLPLMEVFPGYRQIISLAGPPFETLAPAESVSLAALANDEMHNGLRRVGG